MPNGYKTIWKRPDIILCLSLIIFSITRTANCAYARCNRNPCVTTSLGTVLGREVESILANGDLKRVNTYLGIPYALQPTGHLRFADPEPKTSWTGLLRATSYEKTCFGTIYKSGSTFYNVTKMWNPPGDEAALSEDCLYLNVWTPTGGQEKKRPVMVYIYGGEFDSGSSSLWAYNGQYLSAAQDMVVVTLNYRVGAFGFLKTTDGKISGNLGLKDQQMALKWVHDHIHYFGGNNATITIAGRGAGAASVGYHLLSKASWGLFNSAVMSSGSPLAKWAYQSPDDTHSQSEDLLKKLRCSGKDDVLSCLRVLSPLAIYENDKFRWAPTSDGKFLTESPKKLIAAGRYKKAPLIISVNKNEGSPMAFEKLGDHFTRNGRLKPITFGRFQTSMDTIFPDILEGERDTAIGMYTKGIKSNGTALSLTIPDVIGDTSFVCPVLRWADDMSRDNHVFFFKLDYRSSNEGYPDWVGVVHGTEYQWMFGIPLDRDRKFYRQSEIESAEKFMRYLGNFIKTGTPNDATLPNWSRFTGREALCFTSNMSIAGCDVGKQSRDRCWRWNDMLGLSSSGRNTANWLSCCLLSLLTVVAIFVDL